MPDSHFLNHPEIEQLFSDVFTALVQESDRGAVLIGFSHVDNHLRKLFDRLIPTTVGKKKREAMLSYPAPLASAAAKADIALITRLIPRKLYDAIDCFRLMRNEVAHSPGRFRLADQENRLRGMYDLGSNIPAGINRFALDVMMTSFADQLTSSEGPKHPDGQAVFNTPQEVFAHLANKPDVLAILDEKRRRFELAMGVVLICALILHHRDQAWSLVGNEKTLSIFAREPESAATKE